MDPLSLDATSERILLDILHLSIINKGLLDAVSYRADHDDWLELLNELEQKRFLIKEDDNYRVAFISLILLNDNDAIILKNRCECLFNLLRDHYKNSETRKEKKYLKDIAAELRLTEVQTKEAVNYFLDTSSLWCAGRNDLKDFDAAYISVNESILNCKSFNDFVSKVKDWFQPREQSFFAFNDASNPLQGFFDSSQRTLGALHPEPVITSFLNELDSDVLVQVVSRLGLSVDWSLTKEESYSKKTRLRAYLPRVSAEIRALNENDRLIVARNLTIALLAVEPQLQDGLNDALKTIGWSLNNGELTSEGINLKELFFQKGAEHTAYVELRNIMKEAKTSLYIVDAYLDETIFTVLKTLNANIRVYLLTAYPPKDFKLEANKFRKENSDFNLEIKTSMDFHDRFIILDESNCYHVGASIKDAGKKAFVISELEDGAIVNSVLSFVREKWREAKLL